jgi:hypothetical protein
MYPPGQFPPGQYAPPPPPDPRTFGQLEVKLSFFPLMWILYLCTPSVAINGIIERRPWGTHLWNLPAGRYQVEAWYPYLFKSRTSPALIIVDIYPQQVTAVAYRPSWITFLDGSLRHVGMRPALQAPPMQGMLPPG